MRINFNGPANPTGYGVASFNILKAMATKHDISFFPKGQPTVYTQSDHDLLVRLINNQLTYDPYSPTIKIWHQFDLIEHIGRGAYFAYPFFELNTLSALEKIHLNTPDIICVSSNWAKEILQENNINKPINIIPLGVDTDIFNHTLTVKSNNEKYIFLNIGKWEVRKGHDILLDIFRKAFPTEMDVELWILASEHTNSYSTESQLVEWKRKYSIDTRVKLSSGVETQREIANIIANVSCGIFISRAEGWNLELLECMAMNKPVIATNYSAHKEFCTKDNCYLVDIHETEPAHDGKAFIGQGEWAKIGDYQIDQCIEHMRYMYRNRITTNTNGLITAQKLSWNNSADILSRCIDT